jgi:parallel beta-helix repeat protein
MQNNIVKKGLAIGIIILFVGTNLVSGLNIQLKNTTNPLITGRGNSLYVGGSGPNNYTRIQDAIDDAVDGDTVFVYDDSSPYKESLRIKKSINLIGENKTTTILYDTSIDIYSKNNISIHEFTLLSDYHVSSVAVLADEAEYLTISNTIMIDFQYGIHLSYCSNCIIEDNEIRDGYIGIEFHDVLYSSLAGNKLIDNEIGISLYSASNNEINNNTLTNNGIITYSYTYTNSFFGNTVNSKPLLYLENEHDLILDNISVGQLFLICCKNITIKNIELSNASFGIVIIRSDNCLVTNTKLHSNSYDGIYIIGQCQNNTISYNDISSNSYGIETWLNYNSCIIGNTIRFNKYGIGLYQVSKNTIRDNIIENNYQGIYVSGGSQNFITNNLINNSTTDGLYLFYSSLCLINSNTFINNMKNGLYLYESSLCLIKSNNFINNQKNAGFEMYSLTLGNHFRKNYWNSSVGFGPKVIWGLLNIIIDYDPKHGYPIYYAIPWVQFDWFPAKEPYDITTT